MQQNITKFGVVVVANSSCLHLDLDFCSSFRFDVVSVSLCPMHMYMHGKGGHACKCVGKWFDGMSLHNRGTESHDIWWDCST